MLSCPCCGAPFAATTRVFTRSRYLAGRIRGRALIVLIVVRSGERPSHLALHRRQEAAQ